ncbi:conserved hypothetical protein [Candidatus Desulfarcum epimagneticum]|uniref:Uncharacterized protein n=1 Tax=uncultured Desulfobacteraceae bacterium TaxID=218296 RepID=A0A484HMY8_9BACT|nr:conserved hypothetical protein [uncultured Desulfobacteraceae bacterium]
MPKQPHKRLNKYFWDGQTHLTEPFRLRRIIEYASFPDLLLYPFDDLKRNISSIDIEKLRTSEKRKEFIKILRPFIHSSDDWEEAVMKMTNIRKEGATSST